MVLIWKGVDCLLQVENEVLHQVEGFKYEGKMEREIYGQIDMASAIMWTLYQKTMGGWTLP